MPYRCPKMETKMASIYTKTNKNGSISYYGTLNINGKRHRKLLGYDKKTAQTQLSRIEYELKFAPQTSFQGEKTTYQKAYIQFLKELELSEISKKPFDVIKRTVNDLQNFLLQKNIKLLSEIKPEHLNDYICKRSKVRVTNKYLSTSDDYCPTLSITTLNKDIQIIKRFFRFCRDMKWIDNNPATALKYFKQKDKRERYFFKQDEIELIMSNAGIFYDFYYLLLHTGIRATDAYKLAPKHFSEGWLSVRMNKTGDRLDMPLREDIIKIIEPRMHQDLIFPEVQTDRQRRNCVKTIQRLFTVDFVRSNNINLHRYLCSYNAEQRNA
jgi:integrase